MARLICFFEKHVGGISARRLSLCFVLLDILAFLAHIIGVHIYMGGIGLRQLFIFAFTALVIRFHYKMKRLASHRHTWKRPLCAMYASLALITMRPCPSRSRIYIHGPIHPAPFYCLEALPMLADIFHLGQVLVGPCSEFPKKVTRSTKVKRAQSPHVGSTRYRHVSPMQAGVTLSKFKGT
ncbi:hypothetical protein FB451DRAFT_1515719 [Mycena latifolia]|nr:hypothetical protein FB451DRAFT_1515719 [Mycena latifolia]